MHSSLTPTDTQSTEWYQSINKLPLNRFITCIVDNNLSALIISGFPSQLELQLAWDAIRTEYADALGDSENKLYNQLYKDIAILEIKKQQVEILVDCLLEVYYPPFAEKLNKLLYTSFKFDHTNVEAYHKDLKACLNRSKAFKIERDLKAIQFKALEEKNAGTTNKYTEQYFQSVLITLSDHAKFQLPESITVYEYCERLKRYNKFCEQMENRLKK